MADDLKPMLTKVLASGGKKKYYFAYAAGKRKDGKGDGELAVGGQKPKKADIEGELTDCKQVLEGVCWTGMGLDDGQTVYFQGKSSKVSPMVIAKMMLTAKRVVGRQYDFQVPSLEEEGRAANLKEGEGDEAPAAQAAPAIPTEGKAQDLEPRLKSLLVRQKALLDKDPSLKEKFLPLYQQAWALVKAGNPGAAEALDKFEAALNAAGTASGPAAPANQKSDTKEEPDTLESTTFKRVLADLKPRFDKARAINSDLMPQMGQILALAKAGRYADALEMLDQLEIDVDRTLASAPKPAVTGDEFKARLKALLPKYNAAIKEDPALLAQLKPLMGQVIAQGNANQFEQAMPILIQIEQALAVAAPGGKADVAAPPASGMQRLNGLMPAIKAALSAGGPNVARIQTLVAAVSGLLKNKDTVQADKVLDELEPLLKPAAGAGAVDLAAEWKAKLAEWSPAIKAALAAKGPDAAAMAKLLVQATSLSKPGGDMAQALALLTECHDLATKSAGTPKPASKDAAARPLAPIWEAASESVIDQTTALIIELRTLAEDELDRMADDLLNRVGGYLSDVSEMLDEYDQATGDERTAIAADALDFVRQHQSSVAGDRLIKAADANPLNVKINLVKTMGSALDEIAGALQA